MVISGILLIIGMANLPEGFNIFLRILTTICSVLVIIREIKSRFSLWIIIFAGIAVLFNPFFPIEPKDFLIRALIYIISGFIFILKASVPEEHLNL